VAFGYCCCKRMFRYKGAGLDLYSVGPERGLLLIRPENAVLVFEEQPMRPTGNTARIPPP